MIETVESHRPFVQFTEEEISDLDKAFFRRSFEAAAALTGKQCAYLHNIAYDLATSKAAIMEAAVKGETDKCVDLLIQLTAQCARAAGLAQYRGMIRKPLEESTIPKGMSGSMQRDADGNLIPGSGT